MSKDESAKIRNWVYTILGIVTLVSIFVGGVLAWGDVDNKIDDHEEYFVRITEDVDDLELNGCDPAKELKIKMTILEERLTAIQVEQKSGFREILSRLPE